MNQRISIGCGVLLDLPETPERGCLAVLERTHCVELGEFTGHAGHYEILMRASPDLVDVLRFYQQRRIKGGHAPKPCDALRKDPAFWPFG